MRILMLAAVLAFLAAVWMVIHCIGNIGRNRDYESGIQPGPTDDPDGDGD